MRMVIRTGNDFDFISAVCSHGWFVLAPHVWEPDGRVLRTVITLDDECAVPVDLQEDRGGDVLVRSSVKVTATQRKGIRAAVVRMLRVADDLSDFHKLCRQSNTHRQAAKVRFGRLLRGASLFEDVVKVICTCNATWRQTTAMVDKIVSEWGVLAADGTSRGFPTPNLLSQASVSALKRKARLGYRADFVHRFVRDVVEKRIDLEAIEKNIVSSEPVYKMLRTIHGVGDYAAGHLCMLLGYYDRLAVDTEMVRFLTQQHPRRKWTAAAIRSYYEQWHPYQFLAYWYELWQDYVQKHGESQQWQPEQTGRGITSRPS